jgi:hypothetical protein
MAKTFRFNPDTTVKGSSTFKGPIDTKLAMQLTVRIMAKYKGGK